MLGSVWLASNDSQNETSYSQHHDNLKIVELLPGLCIVVLVT